MTEFRLEPAELSALDDHDNLLQTGLWGRMKSLFGWRALGFWVNGNSPLLVLLRPLGGGFSLAYVPLGPEISSVPPEDWSGLAALASALRRELPRGTVFLRFDMPWDGETLRGPETRRGPFFRAPMDIQPPDTVLLDLTGDEDALLGQMKKKNRYNINLAFKKGVTVRQGTLEDLPLWYRIYQETARRDRIALHEYGYYEALFRLAAERQSRWPELRLYLAEIEGEPEAGIIVCHQNRRATYLYGASTNNKRNYMPSYALQWAALTGAREAGCTSYDFYGIPPVEDPEHPMAGLYRFKTGFGGRIVHRPGSWDFPLRPLLYRGYRLAEALRGWYFRKLKKRV